jgi:hypothetical protein
MPLQTAGRDQSCKRLGSSGYDADGQFPHEIRGKKLGIARDNSRLFAAMQPTGEFRPASNRADAPFATFSLGAFV